MPAAFFDRDGVLNLDCGYLHRIEDFQPVTGAVAALAACRAAGFRIFVVTNQSGIARGYYDEAAVAKLHAWMAAHFAEGSGAIDAFRYCPHHPEGAVARYATECGCRKPAPGMIEDVMVQWPTDRARSFLVGDKPSDLAAAHAAGIQGHLFEGGDLNAFVAPILAAHSQTGSVSREAG